LGVDDGDDYLRFTEGDFDMTTMIVTPDVPDAPDLDFTVVGFAGVGFADYSASRSRRPAA
jgi:hypothetical protein